LSFEKRFGKLHAMSSKGSHPYRTRNSAHDLFRRLPWTTILRLSRNVNREARSNGLTYVDDNGRTALITLTLRPRIIDRKKRNALWQMIRILDGAFGKLARLYLQDPSLRTLFPFEPGELPWISMMRSAAYRPGAIVSRWDANTTFGDEDWKEGFCVFEVNGVGVGGLWYGPASAEVALKAVVPELKKIDSRFQPVPHHDMRRLLLGTLLTQRKKLGRTRGVMALAMEKASGSNYVEFECLARFYRKLGYPTIVTEPTDFTLKGDEVFARGRKIDIFYRDTTLSELCLLEKKGHDLRALRVAFRRGQVVSSLEGEFDHKSAFEVFTNSVYADVFTAQERKLFQTHILWTRLLTERKTTDWKGKSVDLVPFTLKNQSLLVLKPNRLYGGQGVVFGRDVNRSAWGKKIESVLREPGDWVIQRLGQLRTKRFFRPEANGAREKELYVVSGFFATDKGLGIVGRMSERTVVNVARRGGLTPILLIP